MELGGNIKLMETKNTKKNKKEMNACTEKGIKLKPVIFLNKQQEPRNNKKDYNTVFKRN